MPSVTNAAAMLGVCGYALAAVPVNDLPPSALVIDAPEPDDDMQTHVLKRKRDKLAAELERLDHVLNQ